MIWVTAARSMDMDGDTHLDGYHGGKGMDGERRTFLYRTDDMS